MTALQKERFITDTLRKDGVPSGAVHLPNIQAEGVHGQGLVKEGYVVAPAPMGVADIGVMNESGHLVGYQFDTSSAKGTINLQSVDSMYVDGLGPDTFGVQLNTVLNGVTLFGAPGYDFWTQNVINYTISTGRLTLVDNIWNFSSEAGWLSANVMYAHSSAGHVVPPVYYYAFGPTFTIRMPFRVDLYINASIWKDRPAVYFNYTVASDTPGSTPISGCYDWAAFNSSLKAPVAPAPTPYFQVNGDTYSPSTLVNDIELDTVGNDNGDTTTFYGINATLSISHWNDTIGGYVPEPAAFNCGTDTGETSDGVDSYWVPGTAPVAHLAPGPSYITGLWNVSGNPGAYQVTQRLSPANAFLFVNPGSGQNMSLSQWVPTSPTGTTVFMMPRAAAFYFEYLMSEYAPFGTVVDPAINATLSTTLVLNTTYGVYTPLVAWGNRELANISSSGSGTPAHPYVLYNNEVGSINPLFSEINGFMFPVFSGILLVGTNASVVITPPSFTIVYPKWWLQDLGSYMLPIVLGISSTNNLQLLFLDVRNVVILNASAITGWFYFYMGLGLMPFANVMFWNCSNNLVAGNTFEDEGSSLFFYGGTGNTVWGNTFLDSPPPVLDPQNTLYNGTWTQGLTEIESGDTIYNNFFNVPVPALTFHTDPTTNVTEYYTEAWNLDRQPSSNYRHIDGVNLTGSIIDSSYQGGNYWSNYGSQDDPYGVLPYNDNGSIHVGGDAVPLIPYTLYQVNITESGLPHGARWWFSGMGVTYNTRGTYIQFYSPNGTFRYNITLPAGWIGPTKGNYTVNGWNIFVGLQFSQKATSSGLSSLQLGFLILGLIALTVLLFFIVLAVAVRNSESVKRLLGDSPEDPDPATPLDTEDDVVDTEGSDGKPPSAGASPDQGPPSDKLLLAQDGVYDETLPDS
jgi:thermopsin